MASNLQDIIGYVPLTGLIKAQTSGVPRVLPEQFFKIRKNVIGDSGRYTQVVGTRETAKIVQYGSPAQLRNLMNVAVRDVKLMSSFEELKLDPYTFQALRNYDNYEMQKMGIDEVTRQSLEFRQRFENLEVTVALQALSNGVVYIDANNNLLANSSGSLYSISFGMSANNQNQLNGVISASWANFSTDIPLQIRNLKAQSSKDTGYQLKYAFYGANIPEYLTANNYVSDYLSRNPTIAAKYLDSAELPDLFGLKWIPVNQAFFQDDTGTSQTVVSGDKVIFTPEPSQDWWEIMEGSNQVPTSLNIQSDVDAAMRSFKTVQGMYAYGAVHHNPPSASMYAGHTFLPVIKVPNAVYQATIVF